MDDAPIPHKAMRKCLGGRRSMRKPRGSWKDAVCRDTVGLFQILNCKSAAVSTQCWRKEIGQAMVLKGAEAP